MQDRVSRGPPPIPESLKCAICGQVFSDPVSVCDGTAYDRACIQSWFAAGNRVSPVTRQELETQEVRPNRALQAAVEDYFRLRETAEKEQKQWVEFVGELQHRMMRRLDQKSQQVNTLKAKLLNSRPASSMPGGQGPIRRVQTAHGDLASSTGDLSTPSVARLARRVQTVHANLSSATDRFGSLASQPSTGESSEQRSDPSLPGPQSSPVMAAAYGAGPAPRQLSASPPADDGHRPVTLLGRLKPISWKKGKLGTKDN